MHTVNEAKYLGRSEQNDLARLIERERRTMKTLPRLIFSGCFLLVASAVPAWLNAEDPTAEQLTFFEQKIRPVLAENCYKCHSARAKKLKAELRLDSRTGLLKGGETGPVVVPGKPEASLLIRAVVYLDSELEMPPTKKLPDRVIADLQEWIRMGAPWPEEKPSTGDKTETGSRDWDKLRLASWAFRPITKPAPPQTKNPDLVNNPIDSFVLEEIEARGLKPLGKADERVLLRRIYIDLTGLPPTPAEVEAFLGDKRPDALNHVVDSLLDSPHYGERWARHWLDTARYSDGLGGFGDNGPLPGAWHYRDWVVDCFNRDLPYDQFVKHQIAGDLIDEPLAFYGTGFFAIGPNYKSDGGDPEAKAQAEAETLADRIDTFSRAFLGLTVQCARCHDHKFDPIPQKDYYSIAGVFKNSKSHKRPAASAEITKRFNEHQKAIKELEEKIKNWNNQNKPDPDGKLDKSELTKLQQELQQLKKTIPKKPGGEVHVLAESGNKDMHVAIRGDLRKKGELAPRRFLTIMAGEKGPTFKQGSGRKELAEAMFEAGKPLASRVMVNRIWQYHFGHGLVRTPSNFGKLGEKPSHPELLDWLASAFEESGWSIKHLHRLIISSATYQRSSGFNQDNFDSDGDNRLLWRMSPRRMEIEAWRDSLLAVTGELDRTIGGKPTDKIFDVKRRTLYTTISRNGDRFASDEFLRLFDFPSPSSTAPKRVTSTVPQQYLFMLNSPFMIARAKALSERLQKEEKDDKARIELAYALLYGRPPTKDEIQIGLGFLSGKEGKIPRFQQYAQVLLSAHEFIQVR